MSKNKIVALKLYGGEMLIGEEDEPKLETGLTVALQRVLVNPRRIAIGASMMGDISVAIIPITSPFKSERYEKRMSVNSMQVMYELNEDELGKELVDEYKSEVSGIRIASASETNSVNSTKNEGQFLI